MSGTGRLAVLGNCGHGEFGFTGDTWVRCATGDRGGLRRSRADHRSSARRVDRPDEVDEGRGRGVPGEPL